VPMTEALPGVMGSLSFAFMEMVGSLSLSQELPERRIIFVQ